MTKLERKIMSLEGLAYEAFDYEDYDTMSDAITALDVAYRVLEACRLRQKLDEIEAAEDAAIISEENYLLGYSHRK